ncbi:MAG: Lrp/AsnC family transcriptional regulator [Chloroflexi bacterium]|nr:Lrp/AsnC family transcriptional regulator [Chloroflexota bacterium]
MIDDTDWHILTLLQQDARLSNAAIGEQVGINASSVYERVKKLERKGIIKGYTAVVDAEKLGRPITAFMRLTASTAGGETYLQAREQLAELCRQDPDILECHSVTGSGKLPPQSPHRHPSALEELVARLRDNLLVANTNTHIVLTTFKESMVVVR